jgi:hypothetical protein
MVRLAAVVAAALLLSGCVTSSPPPAGLSDSERIAFAHQEQDVQWLIAGLPGERPAVTPAFVSSEDYGSLLNECLDDRGLGQIMVFAGGVLTLPQAPLTAEERLSLYLCSATYIVSPDESGYLSTAQRERLYDYYRDWLVPCIEAHGQPVSLAVSKGAFAATPGYVDWNPYYPIEQQIDPAVLSELQSRCPFVPPGTY